MKEMMKDKEWRAAQRNLSMSAAPEASPLGHAALLTMLEGWHKGRREMGTVSAKKGDVVQEIEQEVH